MRRGGSFLDVIATLTATGSGVYLLTMQSTAEGGGGWLEAVARGMGAYFIAKGIFIAWSAALQSRAAEAVEKLVALQRAPRP
jgi:hypothetical protein